ncbi:hypothetical protein BJ878DRAFT_413278, partial [Calycina marina]
IAGIKAGLKHLHSMGFGHDSNPRNIMLDKHDRPVIIDLGGSRQLGRKIHVLGTYG